MVQKNRDDLPEAMTYKKLGRLPEIQQWAQRAFANGEIDDELATYLGVNKARNKKRRKKPVPDLQSGEIVWPPKKRMTQITGLDGKEIGAFSWSRDKSDLVDYDHDGEIRSFSEESLLLGYTQGSESTGIDDESSYESGLETTWTRACHIEGHQYQWDFLLRPKLACLVVPTFRDIVYSYPEKILQETMSNIPLRKAMYVQYINSRLTKGHYAWPLRTNCGKLPDGTRGVGYLAFVNEVEELVMRTLWRMDEPSSFLLDRWLNRKANGQNIDYPEICDEYETIFGPAFRNLRLKNGLPFSTTLKAGSLAEKIVGRNDRGPHRCLLRDAINLMQVPYRIEEADDRLFAFLGASICFEGYEEPGGGLEKALPKDSTNERAIYDILEDWKCLRRGIVRLRKDIRQWTPLKYAGPPRFLTTPPVSARPRETA